MPRLRMRDRGVVQRSSPNPAGDGAGNFQDGWDDYLGPVSMRIEPRQSGSDTERDGQTATTQQFLVHLRHTPKSKLIDARDRVQEIGGPERLLDVKANITEPGWVEVVLLCEQTPVKSPQAGYTPGAETEAEPTFTPGP